MSTKYLARTVIEGGRYHGNASTRRDSNAVNRAREREVSAQFARSIDSDELSYPVREPVQRQFRDKLAPAERWLAAQAGRPWDKVRGELIERFDARTTAGRHVLFDHLLPMVEPRYISVFSRPEFRVDRHGILRIVPRCKRVRLQGQWNEPAPVTAWLGSRLVGRRGSVLFWFIPTANGRYRQGTALDEEEKAHWRSLPRWCQERRDAFGRPTSMGGT